MKNERHLDVFPIKRYGPFPLFVERMTAYWVAIWKCWRTVLDWAVWLYIFIPGLLIFGGMYRDLVRNPPAWLFDIPVALLLTSLAVVQLTGKYRTFAESGDGLFLHRNARWNRGLSASGFLYGIIVRAVVATVVAAVISPVLIRIFEFPGIYVTILALLSAILGLNWIVLRDQVERRWKGWRRTLISLLIRPVFVVVFVWVATLGEQHREFVYAALVFASATALWQMRLRIRKKGTLMHEIAVENAAYIANVGWILSDSLDKKPLPKLRRPVLFKQSRPLIKHRDDVHRLIDSWFKSVLRRFDLLKPFLYFAGAGAVAIILSPLPLAVIVWLVLPLLLLAMLQRQWKQWLSEPYIALFHWREELLDQASIKVKVWGGLPLITLWAIVLAVKAGIAHGSFAWLAIVAIPAIGYYWLKFLSEVFASFSSLRGKKK
ncbi:ABC transporter permease [Cohnella lupini]|uniref:ABC transporter protein EcsB n=1 Tax=Cohnella lupini TaxID=1294267 RepID=A0A3D9IQ60_9BACL|nr:ABC transporter permease [Cohnella lupini]RED63914.1 ABC transporter protein EcsB [Cohnella lupini]